MKTESLNSQPVFALICISYVCSLPEHDGSLCNGAQLKPVFSPHWNSWFSCPLGNT